MIAPWRLEEFTSKFQGRSDLLQYAKENEIPVTATVKAPWSTDANLMHISYEGGILEDPSQEPPEDLYQMTISPKKAPEEPYGLEIEFRKGLPISLKTQENRIITNELDMFVFLNNVGGQYGVGRIDIVENRCIGLKVSNFNFPGLKR